MQNSIVISMDMDWADESVIQDSLSLLSSYEVRSTLFMTNKLKLEITGHEIAIHPNYTSSDLESHLKERVQDFPETTGVRSHTLFYTYALPLMYPKYNIKYQSNTMMLLEHNIVPYKLTQHINELPIFWMDIPYFEIFDNNPSFAIEELGLDQPGLKVFDFHPIHLFLNTKSIAHYEQAKEYYHEPNKLAELANTESPGIRDLFIKLLEYIRDNNIQTKTLSEVNDSYINEQDGD